MFYKDRYFIKTLEILIYSASKYYKTYYYRTHVRFASIPKYTYFTY